MAAQTVYACDTPLINGVCTGNTIQFTVDSDLGEALNTHAIALQNNTDAMSDFFTLDVENVGIISGFMFITFIVGHYTGVVVRMLSRKT